MHMKVKFGCKTVMHLHKALWDLNSAARLFPTQLAHLYLVLLLMLQVADSGIQHYDKSL